MDEEPIEVGAAQTNSESEDGSLSILETVQRHIGQLQACMDKKESCTTTGTEMSQHLGAELYSILFYYFIFFIVICDCYLQLCIHL